MIDNVVPDGAEVLQQLRLTGLGVEVGNAGIEVVGANGMAHGFVLVAELMAVLIVVFAILHRVANGNQALGQREVFLVACLTIHFGGTHVVGGADGVAREFGSVVG